MNISRRSLGILLVVLTLTWPIRGDAQVVAVGSRSYGPTLSLKQSTARNRLVFITTASTHTAATGLTLTITVSKNGGAFSTITPTVTELGNGWYSLALTSSHTNTLGDLAYHITASGADALDFADQVVLATGQQTMTNSTPVVVASDQSAVPVSGTVTATGPLTDTQLRATAVPVSGTVTANAGTGTLATSLASGAVASGAVASGAVASGAFASGSVSDGAVVTLGSKTDAKSTATDTTSVSIMQVLKQISASVQAPASTAVTNAGTFAVQAAGDVAHDSADSGNPVKIGAKAVSSEPSAVTAADRVNLIADLVGKLIVLPYANPENYVNGTVVTITDTTSTATIASAGGSLRNYVTHCTLTNSHATVGTLVKILDGTTVLDEVYLVAGGGGASLTYPVPLKGTAATAVNIQPVTTGANVLGMCNGYKGL